MAFDAAVAAKLMRQLIRDQGCRNRGGRCDCMMLCLIDADEIVAETSEAFRKEVHAIMAPHNQRIAGATDT